MNDGEELPPLTAAQLKETRRRIADLDDRARYILVSAFTPKFVLIYNVSEDTYGSHAPTHASLFKRRKTAAAVARLLGRGIEILPCRVDKRGRLIKRDSEG